jgi:hypothetical protein
MRELQIIPIYNRYQRKVKLSESSKLLLMLTARFRNFQKWRLPYRRAFARLSTRKQIRAPLFSRLLEKGFLRIHLLEHRYRGGLTTLKTRNAFVRRKSVAALLCDEAVRQVEATFSRSPRKSVRKRSRDLQMPKTTVWQVLHRRVRMKPYKATHATKPLDWEIWSCRWSGLLALPISLHVASFCGFI